MGTIEKAYCDVCGTETFKGNELILQENFSTIAQILKLDICANCYSKLLLFFNDKKSTIDEAWKLPEVTPEELDTSGIIV